MNYVRIQICLYTIIHLNIFHNGIHFASAANERYEIDSSYCRGRLDVKLVCWDTSRRRRSLSHYDTAFLNDVSLNKYQPPNEVVNMSNYDDTSVLETMDELYNSVGEETGKTEVKERCPDEQSDTTETDAKNSNSGVVAHTEQCGVNCTKRAEININCNSLKLSSKYIFPSNKYIHVKSSGTIELSPLWANELTNITSLKIESEHGLLMPRNCSWLPPSTEDLDFSYTPLETLTLHSCSSPLKKVSLSRASLKYLSVCHESLEELDASSNSLSGSEINGPCDHDHQNVKILKLDNNQLSHWSTCGWPSLVHLELQHNALVSVDLTSCPSHNLLQIDLSHNTLQVTLDYYPPKLTTINFSHNQLKKMTLFNAAIKYVYASHNSLVTIGSGIFGAASQLQILDLSHNQLAVIREQDLEGLDALRELDLSHNVIAQIGHDAFRPLRSIRSIKIEHNSLQQMDARLLKRLRGSAVSFTATENPWQCSCHLLAALSSTSSAACKPDCPNTPKLTCREGNSVLLAQDVLQRCINAVSDIETGTNGIFLLPEKTYSDEDTSEENKKKGDSQYYMIIPVIIVIVVIIPLGGFCVRKIYLKRKTIKTWFRSRCVCSSSATSNGRLSKKDVERERDLEPGMVLLQNDNP